jgi:hypothetical protein
MPVPSTNWKEATDPNAGSSVIYGAPDVKKISQVFNGDLDVDDIDINSQFFIRDGKLHIINPAGDFTYIVQSSAITADRDVTFPLLTGNDEITFNAQAQNLTNKGIDISAILGLPITQTAISTGALAVTSTAIEVTAETGTVDTLDTLTGLSDDDVVALYAKIGDTITITHNPAPASDDLFLQGGVDINLSETVPTLLVRKAGVFTQFAGSGTTTFLDTLFRVQDDGDTSKQVAFSNAGATTATTLTLISIASTDRSITFPDADDTLVGQATNDVLTNKQIDSDNNTITNIANADIKTSADIAPAKIAVNNADLIVGDGSNEGQSVTMSGDATLTNTGVLNLDPKRFSSIGDLLNQANNDRNHAHYLDTTPNTTFLGTPLPVTPITTTLLEGWWSNSYGTQEIITDDAFFDGGVAHTSSPSTQEGWLTSDHTKFTIDPVNDRMTCQCVGDTTNDSVSFDYGSDRNNSLWTARFRTLISAKADGASGGDIYIGLSNLDSGSASTANHDFMGIRIKNSASTTYTVESVEANEQGLETSTIEETFVVVMEPDIWYHWEIIRTGTGTFTFQFFGVDKKFVYASSLLKTVSITSLIDNLAQWKITNDASISNSGDRTIEFDMLQFWNSDSSILRCNVTGEPAQGVLNVDIAGNVNDYWVSDTAKGTGDNYPPQLILGHAIPRMVEDFTEYSNIEEAHVKWLPQDSANIDINVVDNRLDFDCKRDNSNDSISYALGSDITPSALSNIEWEMRMELTITSHFANTTTPAELFIGVDQRDSTIGANGTHHSIGIKVTHASNESAIGGYDSALNGVLNNLADAVIVNPYVLGTKYYIRVYRNTGTGYGVSVYSDEDMKIETHENATLDCVSTLITMDHFIVKNNNDASTSDSTIQGKIEKIQIWDDANRGKNAFPIQGTGNPDNVGLREMHYDPVGYAIHFQADRFKETQFKIRQNITGNLFFTDADTVRTIDTADITDDVFRFFVVNRVLEGNHQTPTLWTQIVGTTDSSGIVINRIMYRRYHVDVTAHFHYRLEKNTVDNQWDEDDPDGVRTVM